MRLNRFEDHKPEDVEWALNLMKERQAIILENILQRRGGASRQLLESAGFCFGREAKNLGLVDHVVDSPEEFIKQTYGADVMLQMIQPDWKQKLSEMQVFGDTEQAESSFVDDLFEF